MTIGTRFDQIDERITTWMAGHGVTLLRISVGVVFFWFGALKFFPGVSPAESLAVNTTQVLTGGLVPPRASLFILATWECLIGVGLMFGWQLRATLLLLFVQMTGTVTPLFVFPELAFQHAPFVLTIEGQYIIKNIVLVSAAIVVGATVRGGRLVSTPGDDRDQPGS
jgi:uncharacterized membrane protein YkgB